MFEKSFWDTLRQPAGPAAAGAGVGFSAKPNGAAGAAGAQLGAVAPQPAQLPVQQGWGFRPQMGLPAGFAGLPPVAGGGRRPGGGSGPVKMNPYIKQLLKRFAMGAPMAPAKRPAGFVMGAPQRMKSPGAAGTPQMRLPRLWDGGF